MAPHQDIIFIKGDSKRSLSIVVSRTESVELVIRDEFLVLTCLGDV